MEIISQTKPSSRNVPFVVAFDADTAEPLIRGPDGSSAVAIPRAYDGSECCALYECRVWRRCAVANVNQAKVRSGPIAPPQAVLVSIRFAEWLPETCHSATGPILVVYRSRKKHPQRLME